MRQINKSVFLFFAVTAFLLAHAQAQMQWGWARNFGGVNNESPAAIAADSRNGLYVFGNFSGSITAGSNTLTSPGGSSMYLVKYDTSGNVVWAKSFGSGGQDTAASITTDKNSNIIISGSFENSITFGSTVLTSSGASDAFIAKLRSNGTVVWAKQFTGTISDKGGPLKCDNQLNIYTVGAYRSNNFTIDGASFAAPQPYNVYYCKLDSNGNRLWAKSTSSSSAFGLYGLDLLSSGNLLMYGTLQAFGGGVNFNTSVFSTPMNSLYSSLFTVKTDANGNFISQSVTQGARDFPGGTALTPSQNVVKAGWRNFLSNSTPFAQAYLCDSNNSVLRSRTPDNLNFNNASSSMSDVTAAKNGRMYTVGNSYGNNSWNGIPLNQPLFTVAFVVWEMDDTLAVKNILTTGYQPNIGQSLTRIVTDTSTGTIYAAGSFSTATTFTVGSNILTSNGQSDVFIGQIKPSLLPTISSLRAFAGADVTICAGANAVIGSAGATGGQPPYSYSWSPVAGLSAPAAASTQASPAATTTYILTVTDAASNTAKDTVVVTVNPLSATPTITTSGPVSFCQGGSVTLTSSAGSSYLWSNGATTQSITVGSSGNYSVQITNANGCQSAASAAVSVTVNPLPSTPTITAGGPTTFCQGGSVVLTSSTGSSYLWSNGATTQSITVSSSGSYSVQVTNANGCQSGASAATTVTVNPLPATPTITTGGPTTFCQGGSVTLTSSAGSSYLWGNGATTQSITVGSSGNYSVQVTNANGCQSGASAATTVTVNPLPATPTITAGGPTTFCQGGSITLTSSAGSSYLWSNGATTQSITVAGSGNYSVQVTNVNGCQSAASSATAVTVNPLPPIPTITQAGNTLTSSAASGNQWHFNGTAIAGATSQSYTYTTGGNYSVTVTNASGCSSSSAVLTAMRMASSNLDNGQQFYYQVAPNPVPERSAAVLRYQLLAAAAVSVYIADTRGQQVLLLMPRTQQAPGIYSFAIGNKLQALGKGMHYVVYVIDGKRIAVPVLIQ
jgi:hypothetical protein